MIADQILLIHNLIPKSVQFVFHIEGISNIPYYVLQYLPLCVLFWIWCVYKGNSDVYKSTLY